MRASALAPRRRLALRPQLERDTPLVAIAAARQIVEEVSLGLGIFLGGRYATRLAHRAKLTYAHSPSFREKLRRPGDAGREQLYLFMRHCLAARFHAERPELYSALPREFALGEPLAPLSNDARLIGGF